MTFFISFLSYVLFMSGSVGRQESYRNPGGSTPLYELYWYAWRQRVQFSVVLVINRTSILAIWSLLGYRFCTLVLNWLCFRRSYFFRSYIGQGYWQIFGHKQGTLAAHLHPIFLGLPLPGGKLFLLHYALLHYVSISVSVESSCQYILLDLLLDEISTGVP